MATVSNHSCYHGNHVMISTLFRVTIQTTSGHIRICKCELFKGIFTTNGLIAWQHTECFISNTLCCFNRWKFLFLQKVENNHLKLFCFVLIGSLKVIRWKYLQCITFFASLSYFQKLVRFFLLKHNQSQTVQVCVIYFYMQVSFRKVT